MTTRDDVREAVLGAKLRSKKVELVSGLTIEVRQPTVGYTLDSVEVEDRRRQMLKMVLDHCYMPGTNDRVFGPEDAEVFAGLPTTGDYARIMDAITDLMDLKGALTAARKN